MPDYIEGLQLSLYKSAKLNERSTSGNGFESQQCIVLAALPLLKMDCLTYKGRLQSSIEEEIWLSRTFIWQAGGWIGKKLSSVECLRRTFDGAMRKGPPSCWRFLAPMRHTRKHFKFCYFRTRVRAAGGMTGKNDGQFRSLGAFIHFKD